MINYQVFLIIYVVYLINIVNSYAFSKHNHLKLSSSYLSLTPKINLNKHNAKTNSDSLITSISSKLQDSSLALGAIGILTVLINRLSIPLEGVSDIQSRSDIIAVISCSALLLAGLSEKDVVIRERDTVPLLGYALKTPLLSQTISVDRRNTLTRSIEAIISNTPVTSVHILSNNSFIARGGVISATDDRQNSIINTSKMTILIDSINNKEEIYLPDLQILPGKIEFSYLPINIQSVLICPFQSIKGGIIMSTNKAKSITLKDLIKIRSLTSLIEKLLE